MGVEWRSDFGLDSGLHSRVRTVFESALGLGYDPG